MCYTSLVLKLKRISASSLGRYYSILGKKMPFKIAKCFDFIFWIFVQLMLFVIQVRCNILIRYISHPSLSSIRNKTKQNQYQRVMQCRKIFNSTIILTSILYCTLLLCVLCFACLFSYLFVFAVLCFLLVGILDVVDLSIKCKVFSSNKGYLYSYLKN